MVGQPLARKDEIRRYAKNNHGRASANRVLPADARFLGLLVGEGLLLLLEGLERVEGGNCWELDWLVSEFAQPNTSHASRFTLHLQFASLAAITFSFSLDKLSRSSTCTCFIKSAIDTTARIPPLVNTLPPTL